jgi:hypothetical protein
MPNINERPVCHRAEDLVTYLYGEAGETDARDFTEHLQQCDACRSEFGVFQQVHNSILLWRNEALGSAFSPTAVSTESAVHSTQFVQPERRLPAFAALREFFSVSPLWLRAATVFGALLLCVLAGLTISRSLDKPAQLASTETGPKYSQQDFDRAVQKRVDQKIAEIRLQQSSPKVDDNAPGTTKPAENTDRPQLAVNRVQPKTSRPRGLSRQEREQLAADLRLIPRDDDELPFVLSDEPNQ